MNFLPKTLLIALTVTGLPMIAASTNAAERIKPFVPLENVSLNISEEEQINSGGTRPTPISTAKYESSEETIIAYNGRGAGTPQPRPRGNH
ncbi:MAG: hypothetical protein AAFR77_04805 [Cyanobacteria bacterium J06631_2]